MPCTSLTRGLALQWSKIDDPVDAAPVHLACGVWGLLAVGLFASPHYVESTKFYGVFYGGSVVQLGIQVLGAVAILLWSGILTGSVFYLLHRIGWLRVDFEDEVMGLDKLLANETEEAICEEQQFPKQVTPALMSEVTT